MKTLRRELKLSQEALAKALGVRRQTVTDWERGACKPSLSIEQVKTLERYLRQANMTFADLPDDLSN